jgi:restriction system protein
LNVTGGSGDEGIDGSGTMTVGGLVTFRVVFQAKRWRNAVGPDVISRLRGDLQGKGDRGLVITTAQFTSGAREQATRIPPAIDLIDGDRLCDLLLELELGVRRVLSGELDEAWFEQLEADGNRQQSPVGTR